MTSSYSYCFRIKTVAWLDTEGGAALRASAISESRSIEYRFAGAICGYDIAAINIIASAAEFSILYPLSRDAISGSQSQYDALNPSSADTWPLALEFARLIGPLT
jgi:hypothetical protein